MVVEDFTLNLHHNFGCIDHEFFQINRNHLTVKKGYQWDGASGIALDTDNFMVPSLVHDILFQSIRDGLLSSERFNHANIELKLLCKERGMSSFRAWYVFKAVSLFGKKYTKSDIKEVE